MGLSDHLLDRLDTRDRLLGKGKTERNRASQPPVDINWTSTHPLQNTDPFQRTATESGEDDGLLWSDVLEHTEDFDLELFDAVPLKDSPSDSVHTGVNIAEGEEVLGLRERWTKQSETNQKPEEYFTPRTRTRGGKGLVHVGHCVSKLVQASLCD
jgi:hypothetical protein